MRKIFLVLFAFIGTIFGLLFAPRSGKELRERLKKDWGKEKFSGDNLKEDAKNVGTDIAKVFKDFTASSKFKGYVKKGREKVDVVVKKGQNIFEDLTGYGKKEINGALKKGKAKVNKLAKTVLKSVKKIEDKK